MAMIERADARHYCVPRKIPHQRSTMDVTVAEPQTSSLTTGNGGSGITRVEIGDQESNRSLLMESVHFRFVHLISFHSFFFRDREQARDTLVPRERSHLSQPKENCLLVCPTHQGIESRRATHWCHERDLIYQSKERGKWK